MQTGDKYFDSKSFHDLLSSYEKSVREGQPIFLDVDDLADIADYYSLIGEKSNASAVIDFARNMYPGSAPPLVFQAREALADEDFEKAEELAEEIIDKDDPDYKYLKAEILIAQNETEEADNYLREYFRTVEPDEYEDFVLDVANIYVDYGVNDKAYEWMMRTGNCKRDEYKELMARVLFGLGEFDRSAKIFDELIDKDPYSKRYWNALASAQFMNEDFDEAVASSEYAIAIDPEDTDGLLAKANSLYRLNRYEDALTYYERYSRLMPEDEVGLLSSGTCLVNLSRYEEAIEKLENALDVAPEDSQYKVQIYQEMAFAYSSMKKPKKALDCIDKADRYDCDHTDMDVLRGHILLENGMLEEADKAFQKAIITSDSAPNILLRIMVSLYDNKYVETSYNMFKRFFEITDEDFDEGYSYMALCCWDLKRTEEFLHYLKIAVERNPKEVRSVLGHIFPKEMKVEDYYNYIHKKINDKEQ